MTPRELGFRLAGVQKRLIREHNERAWLAYHAAYLPRSKKPVPFKRLMFRDRAQRQTWQQQLQIAQTWHKVFNKKAET